jgi:acetolactate synthase-1/2/3 large subunit
LIHVPPIAMATAPRPHLSDAELAPAVERHAGGKTSVIWAGSGAMFSDSGSQVTALMELLDAAVITTQSGRGIVPETDMRCIGHFATFPLLQDFVAKSDLLVSIGVRFRGNETSNWSIQTPAEHIGIDADAAPSIEIFPHSIGLVGDANPYSIRSSQCFATGIQAENGVSRRSL